MHFFGLSTLSRALLPLGAALLVLPLLACTTLVAETAPSPRALDPARDDLSGLVVAIDVPVGLQPVPEKSVLALASGEPGWQAPLALVDPGEAAGTLPPPVRGRTYYLFGIAETDRETLRHAQDRLRGFEAGSSPQPSLPLSLQPSFCATGEIDPERTRFSVLLVLPGLPHPQPLMREEAVATIFGGRGETLQPC